MNPPVEYQSRIREEKAALNEKITKLLAFMDTKIFENLDQEDKMLLRWQWRTMDRYSDILGRRIARFK